MVEEEDSQLTKKFISSLAISLGRLDMPPAALANCRSLHVSLSLSPTFVQFIQETSIRAQWRSQGGAQGAFAPAFSPKRQELIK